MYLFLLRNSCKNDMYVEKNVILCISVLDINQNEINSSLLLRDSINLLQHFTFLSTTLIFLEFDTISIRHISINIDVALRKP